MYNLSSRQLEIIIFVLRKKFYNIIKKTIKNKLPNKLLQMLYFKHIKHQTWLNCFWNFVSNLERSGSVTYWKRIKFCLLVYELNLIFVMKLKFEIFFMTKCFNHFFVSWMGCPSRNIGSFSLNLDEVTWYKNKLMDGDFRG